MIDFELQTRYLQKILLSLVENKSMTFVAAAAEVRKVFMDKTTSAALPALTLSHAGEHGVTPLHVAIVCEPTRMQLADDLRANSISAQTAIHGVSHTSQRVIDSLKTMVSRKTFGSANSLIETSKHLHFTKITFMYADILEFYIVRAKLDVTKILDLTGESAINRLQDTVSAIHDKLPGVLEIASNMMKQYNLTFADSLKEMLIFVTATDPTHKIIEDVNAEQIRALKLEAKDIEILFPDLSNAHILMDEYLLSVAPAAPAALLTSEQEALNLIGLLGFNAVQAKNILAGLNADEIADLPHAAYHAIPGYCRAVEWLLTFTDLDGAHAEIIRLISSAKSTPRFAIAYEDNNYADNLRDAKLQPWHVEKLLSDKKVKEAFTQKYRMANLQNERTARTAIFDQAFTLANNQFQTARSEYYSNEIYKLLETAFGFNEERAIQVGNQFSEMEIAVFPFAHQHDFAIFRKLLTHTMYMYNMEMDEALNTLWRISTNRFNSEKNPLLYSIASKVTIPEWFFNIISDQIRDEIGAAIALQLPHAASDTQREHTGTNELRLAIGRMETENRAALIEQAQKCLIEKAGFDVDAAGEVVNTALSEPELGLVPFVVRVKLPIMKEMLKALIVIDPSLNSFADAEAQMRIIIDGKFDDLGQRFSYEAMAGDYHLAQWHLNLIPKTEKAKLFVEAIAARTTFQKKMKEVLIDVEAVTVRRNVRNLLSVPAFNEVTFTPLQQAAVLAPLPTHNYYRNYPLAAVDGAQTFNTPALPASNNTAPTSGYNVLLGATGSIVLIASFAGYLLAHNPIARSGLSSRLFSLFKPAVNDAALATKETEQRYKI